jgi:hypothetical protein
LGHPEQGTPLGPAVLARRLRELRTDYPGGRVTQGMLAKALGGSTALISGWENVGTPTVPPVSRLRSYATLFGTVRSLDGTRLRLLPETDLTPDETLAQNALYDELVALRAAATDAAAETEDDGPRSLWQFPDGGDIRIVCGEVPAESAGAYAKPTDPNYTRLHRIADPDALIELYGHVRMMNPDSDVRYLRGDEMGPDDLTAHVVLLGGLRLNPAARFFARVAGLPVRQVVDENIENGEVFEIDREGGNRRRFLPTFLEGDPGLGLIDDVALFARMPNPNFQARTLTLCNGVFSRGVFGAVRILTDRRLRHTNEDYLRDRFSGDPEFGLLLRVPVFRNEASTPDLTNDYHRLYAWTTRKETE